jgi:cyanate lyase
MSNLTQIEKALLQEFESLASGFEDLARQQSQLSDHFSAKMEAMSERQTMLEAHLRQVTEALQRQNSSVTALIDKAQRLTGNWH